MSGYVMGEVFTLALTRAQREVLLALADHADDDGRNVYPSQARIAWKIDLTIRHVRRVMAELEALGVLVVVRPAGARRPTEYRIDLEAAQRKPEFGQVADSRPDILAPRPDILAPRPDIFASRPDIAMSDEPSIKPSIQNRQKEPGEFPAGGPEFTVFRERAEKIFEHVPGRREWRLNGQTLTLALTDPYYYQELCRGRYQNELGRLAIDAMGKRYAISYAYMAA